MRNFDYLTENQVNRTFIDNYFPHLKKMTVKEFRQTYLPLCNITTEIRGNPLNKKQQRHCDVYYKYEIISVVYDKKKK